MKKLPQENYVIEMRNITKAFGEFKANDNINLQVKKGEIHALLGENGAGRIPKDSFYWYQKVIQENGENLQ